MAFISRREMLYIGGMVRIAHCVEVRAGLNFHHARGGEALSVPETRGGGREMTLSRFVVATTLAMFAVVSVPSISEAVTPSCSVTVDSPHFSTGANGVIVKSHTKCNYSVAKVYSNIRLFLCRIQYGTLNSIKSYCALESEADYAIYNPVNGADNVRYAPPAGTPGALGNGWWIGEGIWSTYSSKGPVGGGQILGPWAYIETHP